MNKPIIPSDYFTETGNTFTCKLCGYSFTENRDLISSGLHRIGEIITQKMTEHLMQRHLALSLIHISEPKLLGQRRMFFVG